jgi:hypothetical protein
MSLSPPIASVGGLCAMRFTSAAHRKFLELLNTDEHYTLRAACTLVDLHAHLNVIRQVGLRLRRGPALVNVSLANAAIWVLLDRMATVDCLSAVMALLSDNRDVFAELSSVGETECDWYIGNLVVELVEICIEACDLYTYRVSQQPDEVRINLVSIKHSTELVMDGATNVDAEE